ncbi:histidine kinase with GAF domain [Oscillatoria acuminata PCC 6304]|uniref:histidine kinase n=2 Tax=Oscillatoria acuminata TaxID=118323 RepID=K9TN91_9CYAN|nr:histidine kinase with GAF domain [Oscillatoria acuminata PCC 6304]
MKRLLSVTAIDTEISQRGGFLMKSQRRTSIAQGATEPYKTLSRAIARIRESLDLEHLFQATVTDLRQLLDVDRVAVFRLWPESQSSWGQIIAEDVRLPALAVLGAELGDRHRADDCNPYYQLGGIQVIPDISPFDLPPSYQDLLIRLQVKSHLCIPLHQKDNLWGLLWVHQCQEECQWEASEIEFLRLTASHLGLALERFEEQGQFQAQTSQLTQAAQRERALATTIEKIRRSLDIHTLFQTTTQEVRQLLEADRVGVYRFKPDWSGNFVGESVSPGWNPLMGNLPDIADTHLQETQGGRYRENQALAVNDIYNVGHAQCHIELLETFQAKAYIIVPILAGETLWGLLAAYQNSGPRHWYEYEVELLSQIGAQFGVAVHQAELFEQLKHQKKELSVTLENLQQAQSQLVQSEKMASLGQLVAGVAHEINNPVNFIYGNLTHVTDYVRDLLGLVEQYQEYYPTPHEAIQEFSQEIESDFLKEDLPKILSSMKVGVERIRGIVLSLRNFSRLDESEKKRVNLHEGIDSTLLILQHRLKSKGDRASIHLIKEYAELPLVDCYAAQMNQVFMNILSNAIDALEMRDRDRTPEQIRADPSWIKISSEWVEDDVASASPGDRCSTGEKTPGLMKGNVVVIRICDNGPGIPDEVRSRIFDPFFTTKPIGSGTGLGLSISYQIVVEKHGGSLTCLSQPGQGTEFRIELPMQPVPMTSQAA